MNNAANQVRERGLKIQPQARITSHGAFREFCVREYPGLFARNLGLNPRIKVSEKSSISAFDALERGKKRATTPRGTRQ